MTDDPTMERGFQVYLDRNRRLKREPRYGSLDEWAASPSGVRYAASHGLGTDAAPAPADDQMTALLNQLAALIVQRGGQVPVQGALAGLARPPRFRQGYQPLDAPALPPGFTYGRCTYSRRGVEQVTIRVPFDQLVPVAAALHDAQAD